MNLTRSRPANRFRSCGLRREVLGSVALSAAALSAASAEAAVVYSGEVDLMASVSMAGKNFVQTPISVDLPGGASFEAGYGLVGISGSLTGANLLQTQPSVEFLASGGGVIKLANALIDATGPFDAGPDAFFLTSLGKGKAPPAVDSWAIGDTGFFGFRFDNGGTWNYGWAQLTLGKGWSDTVLIDYAYDDSGTGLVAGAGVVPEPATAWLCLVGGGALLFRRRRR
jgi:hypothetical protein